MLAARPEPPALVPWSASRASTKASASAPSSHCGFSCSLSAGAEYSTPAAAAASRSAFSFSSARARAHAGAQRGIHLAQGVTQIGLAPTQAELRADNGAAATAASGRCALPLRLFSLHSRAVGLLLLAQRLQRRVERAQLLVLGEEPPGAAARAAAAADRFGAPRAREQGCQPLLCLAPLSLSLSRAAAPATTATATAAAALFLRDGCGGGHELLAMLPQLLAEGAKQGTRAQPRISGGGRRRRRLCR